MARPVTVYRWDDAGAPQITGRTPAEIIDVLKKCLVDGYGSKAPLGWTMPFEDSGNYKAVFRNSPAAGGSGGCVQCKSSNGTNNANIAVSMTPAKSFTDIDTPIQPGFTRPFSVTTGFTTWILLGTPTGFYLIAGLQSSNMSGWVMTAEFVAYVGDYDSVILADAGRFIVASSLANSGNLTGTNYSAWNTSAFHSGSAGGMETSSAVQALRIFDADNFDNSKTYGITFPGQFYTGPTMPVGSDITKKRDVYQRPIIQLNGMASSTTNNYDRNGILSQQSDVSPFVRGFLPGYIFEISARYTNQPWPVTEDINGQSHLLLRTGANSITGYWLNMEEW